MATDATRSMPMAEWLDTPNDPTRPLETPRLRLGRLQRLREHMAAWQVDACVLLDPINVRYATGARNMTPFMHRNPARYAFVPLDGPVVMFEAMGANHLAEGIETIDEVRPSTTVSAVAANTRLDEKARQWADELSELIRRQCGPNARVGIERVYAGAARALEAQGFGIVDAQQYLRENRSEAAQLLSSEGSGLLPQGPEPIDRALTHYDEHEPYLESGAIQNADWDIDRIGFYPYPYPSYTEELVRRMRETRVEGEDGFLDDLDPSEVADDLVAYDPVRTALQEAGGPPAFDVPEDDGYERQETIRF